MRVLLISIISDKPTKIETAYFPLGLGYLISYSKQYIESDFKIIFSNGENLKPILDEFQPDLVGITVLSHYFGYCKNVAKIVKQWKDVPVIIGGQHITAMPECLNDDMNIAVLGEGEETFTEILKYHSKNKLFENIDSINGVAYKKCGFVVKTKFRSMINNLDSIPLPDRSLFNINPYDAQMVSSRGCPFKCEFCSSSHFWNYVRYHSPERVVDEMMFLVETHGVKFINMFDDLFACNLKRLTQIAEILEKRMYDREPLQMVGLVRANVMTPEIAKVLRKMGFKDFAMGFESGSDKLLKRIKGNSASVEANFRAVDILREAGGACIGGSVIVGSPGETVEDAYATIDMITKLPINGGEAYLASPFPGTEFWDVAVKSGLVHKDMDWNRLSLGFEAGKDVPIIINNHMNRDDIYNYWQDANRILHTK